jgi:hypothetical protein
MKLKKWYFRESHINYTDSVEAKTIRGALTKIRKKQRECAEKLGSTVFWTIFEKEIKASNIRCILVTYVFPNGDIKQDVL